MGSPVKGSLCFYAWLSSPELFRIVDFYRNDIRILQELGYRVHLASHPTEIALDCDLYVTWWWGGGLPTLAASLPRRRPNIFFGAHHYAQPGWDFKPERLALRVLLKQLAMRTSLGLASANVFLSAEEFDIVRHLRVRNPHLLHLAVDTDIYRPRDVERDLLVTITHLTGPNVRRKMVVETVEAFAQVLAEFPDERLVIVGERREGYPQVMVAAERLGVGDRVRFVGRLSPEEKLEILQRTKVYLQPSRYEGFGLAIAEAMACEAPVIVTAGGAVEEVVGDAQRYAEPTVAGIAKALGDLLRDPDDARTRGRAGRARVVEQLSLAQRRDGIRRVLATV